MIWLFRFSPARLAFVYVMRSGIVLVVFAIPLWYVWRANYGTLRTYVRGDEVQAFVDTFQRLGAPGLASAIDARLKAGSGDEILLFVDPSKTRLAGNVAAWPSQGAEAPGTFGLVIDRGGATLRVVASHVNLPGGYRLLIGRESARFQSLVELFWYGMAGALVVVLLLGAALAWMVHRALLAEVRHISETASGIVGGDLSHRVTVRGRSEELDTLARTVNGMLERVARQNADLAGEITVRRDAEQALQRAQGDLERLVAERTAQLETALREVKSAESLLSAEKRTLEVIAGGAGLAETLDGLCRAIDAHAPGVMSAVLLMDPDGQRLWPAAGPRLPAGWTHATTPFAVGASAGACGTAAFRKAPVVTADIATDPLWIGQREVALGQGFRASWAHPLVSRDREVLGTFVMYFGDPRTPERDDLELLMRASHIALIAVERKRADEALQRAQAALGHVTRVATLGELTASIAHEINQPLGAIVNNASACVRWLAAQNLEEARRSASLVIADGHRTSLIIRRIRALATKAPPRRDWVDVNDTIREVAALAQSELDGHGVALTTDLSDDPAPLVLADRIQLQHVMLNLIVNALEAMSAARDSRDLMIRSRVDAPHGIVVAVGDSGPHLDPQSLDRIFDAFYTTKPEGLGMGLAICRSIIEAHGGRLWATANEDRRATFQFTLPVAEGKAS